MKSFAIQFALSTWGVNLNFDLYRHDQILQPHAHAAFPKLRPAGDLRCEWTSTSFLKNGMSIVFDIRRNSDVDDVLKSVLTRHGQDRPGGKCWT